MKVCGEAELSGTLTNGLCEIMHEAQNYLLKRKTPEVSFSHFAASSRAVPA